MHTLLALPREVVDNILSFLDPASILKCQRVSKTLRSIAQTEHVLRLICKRSGYLGPDEELSTLRQPLNPDSPHGKIHDGALYSRHRMSGRSESDALDHLTLLSTTFALESVKDNPDLRWVGGMASYHPDSVPCRVDYDHVDDVVLATNDREGELAIVCAETASRCDSISGARHLTWTQLSEGWLIRGALMPTNAFRIWCFERLVPGSEARTGSVVAKGSITCTDAVHLFKFRFPHLVVISQNELSVFDVVSKDRVEVTPMDSNGGRILLSDVDFDDEFVFVICLNWEWQSELQVYDRRRRVRSTVFDVNETIQRATVYTYKIEDAVPNTSGVVQAVISKVTQEDADTVMMGFFDAIRIDSKTNSLCVLANSTLLVLFDYKASVRGEQKPRGAMMALCGASGHLKMSDWHPDLAVSDGRAAFLTEGGVALLNLTTFRNWNTSANDPLSMPIFCFASLLDMRFKCPTSVCLTPTRLIIAPVMIDANARQLIRMPLYPSHVDHIAAPLWIDFNRLKARQQNVLRAAAFEKLKERQLEGRKIAMGTRFTSVWDAQEEEEMEGIWSEQEGPGSDGDGLISHGNG